jgi:tetratricopeptide (TPR) repeat protein
MQLLLSVRDYVSRRSYFPKIQGAILMKKILLTIVLGVAVSAVAQSTTPPAQGQSATPPAPAQAAAAPAAQAAAPAAQAAPPVIKDPAEYNAYVAAYQQKDINARISGLEAFLTQYPNSVMKNQALEILMQAYQQANNVNKAMDTATKLVAVDPCQVPAMTLLAYIDRQRAQSGDPNGKQESADGGKYGQQGLDCLPKFAKPEGTSEADFQKMKDQMKGNFIAAVGWAALQEKDYKKAAESLKAAVDANPPDSQKDLSLVYPLALSYLGQTPPDYQNGIWFAARAAAIAPAANAPGIEKYARSQYIKFHSADDGWADVLGAAKANAAQVPIKPPPTPAEQAHKMVQDTPPDKMDFATWEFVFTNGAQEDQDLVWNAIKGKAVQMNGTIISTTPTEFSIAGSSDDIELKKADISLKFEEKVPVRMIPKDGASFDFQGEPASYTPNPFMMTMEKGQLLRAKAAPAPKKPPVHHKPAAQ